MTAKQPDNNRRKSLTRAFLESAAGTLLSRVLGAVRDIAIANFLGASAGSDAFWIAFTVPNVFRRFVADEGLTGAVIPAVSDAEQKEGKQAARQLANTMFTVLLAANALLCLFGMLFPDILVRMFASGFVADPEKFQLTVTLTRWLFPFVFFVSMLSLTEALLNHRGHFFIPKVAPGLVSLCMVLSVLVLPAYLDVPVYALVAGVLVGGAVHLAVAIPPLLRLWGRLKPAVGFAEPRFKRLTREMGKVALIGISAQLNIILLRQFASLLEDGSVTRYWYANRVVDLAQGIVAVGIGSALMPALSRARAKDDWPMFRHEFGSGIRLAAYLLFPCAAALAVFSEPVCAMLFGHGAYGAQDVAWTARTLVALTPFFLAVAGINIAKKAYFAMNRRTIVLIVGIGGLFTTGITGWLMIDWWSIVGLGAALSISTVLQLVAYVAILQRTVGDKLALKNTLPGLLRTAVASLPVAAVLYAAASLGEWSAGPASGVNLAVFLGGVTVAGIAYAVGCHLLAVEEQARFLGALKRRFGRGGNDA